MLLVLASSGVALCSCEYMNEEAAPATAHPGTSRPAPPPLPKADPDLAAVRARNQAQLEIRLGPRPDGVVLGGSGGLGGDGYRASVIGIPKGSYKVTAACLGVLKASLTISQPDRRGGTGHELALDCGKAKSVNLDLDVGPVSAHAFRMTTEPGSAAVAGFWMVPAA
jgi:hypothetical protein